jgi:hypothetical protein
MRTQLGPREILPRQEAAPRTLGPAPRSGQSTSDTSKCNHPSSRRALIGEVQFPCGRRRATYSLLAAEVLFRCLYRDVAEEKLDLVEFTTSVPDYGVLRSQRPEYLLAPLPQPWVWVDTKPIPASKTNSDGTITKAYFKIRARFADFIGEYVLHCHIPVQNTLPTEEVTEWLYELWSNPGRKFIHYA